MTSKNPSQKGLTAAALILSLIPPVALLALIFIYGVNIPIGDQWEFVPLLEKFLGGGRVTLGDLWMLHNEHRLIFPRLIMLGLARLTGWNIMYELATNVILAAATYMLLLMQVNSSRRALKIQGVNWIAPAVSIVVFSLAQWQNWLWGWQLQIFLNVLAVVAGFITLTTENFSWPRFALSILLGIIATYSFANGILYWILGFVLISLLQTRRSKKLAALGIWAAVSALITFSYLYGYHKPGHHPSLCMPLSEPLKFAAYVFTYLGTPLSSKGALIAGGFGLAVTLILIWHALKHRQTSIRVLLPYLAMAAYAVGSASITAMGRVGFGVSQSSSSRYTTISGLLWICILCLSYLCIARRDNAEETVHRIGKRFRLIHQTLLVLVVMIITANSLASYPIYKLNCANCQYARDILMEVGRGKFSQPPLVVLQFLYGQSPDKPLRESKILYRYHLSLFH